MMEKPSPFPIVKADVFKCLVLSDQWFKNEIHIMYKKNNQ